MLPSYIKSLILDMDGVLWRSDDSIGNLNYIFDLIHHRGILVAFATNNGTLTPLQYVQKLASFGVNIKPWQVVTSAITTANLLKVRFPSGGKVFAIGENGVTQALTEQGFTPEQNEGSSDICAVVVGLDRMITFKKMAEATLLVRQGVPFYATNPDRTYPTPRGEIPGAGAWISVISQATNIEPIYAGKPSPELLYLARERLGTSPRETLVVGDRITTDIAGGQAAGMPTALVLTGVSSEEEGKSWKPKIDIIAPSLQALIEN
jgi:4-nitrophenyl phosphatase